MEMQKAKERITLEDSILTIMTKLSDGNPGALSVIARVLQEGKAIDPYAEPLMTLLMMDSFGLYGSHVWIVYKDICGSSLPLFLAVLRAMQFGLLNDYELRNAIAAANTGRQTVFDPKELLALVRAELPKFDAVDPHAEDRER